jgi:ABC-type bacteriocin/lantibiotic exporter with double-glycine peptidase domain
MPDTFEHTADAKNGHHGHTPPKAASTRGGTFKSRAFRLYTRFYARRWRYFAVFFIGIVIASVTSLWTPWATRLIIDEAIPERQVQKLLLIIVSIFAANIVVMLANSGAMILFSYGCEKVLNDIRSVMLRHVARLPSQRFMKFGAGDVATRVSGDVSSYGDFFSGTTSSMLISVTTFACGVAYLSYLDFRLLLVSCVILPFQLLSAVLFRGRLVKTSRDFRQSSARISAFIMEVLVGIQTVRSLRMIEGLIRQLTTCQTDALDKMKRARFAALWAGLTRGLIADLPTCVSLGYGGLLTIRGDLSIGELMAFQQVLGRVYGPVHGVMNVVMSAIASRIPRERLDDLIGEEDLDTRPGGESEGPAPRLPGNDLITAKGVSYSYNGTKVIRDVDLSFEPSGMTVIVGPSGSGKTTLARLLSRTLCPDEGTLYLGEAEMACVPDAEIHRRIAMVDQEPTFFSCSIQENLLYAASHASIEMVGKAIWAADLDGFVRQLPSGVETKLNDRASCISGGELRRLAMARALLKGPNILILDETTSGVAPDSEERILKRIREMYPDMMTIIITHRLTPMLRQEATIVFMENGEVRGVGTHEDLCATLTSYRQLYSADETPAVLVASSRRPFLGGNAGFLPGNA